MYHTEPITRNFIKKVSPYVPDLFIGGDLKPAEIEKYSRDTATHKERSEYFGLAGSVFTVGAIIIAFVSMALMALYMFLVRDVYLIGLFYIVFIVPLFIGLSFSSKSHSKKMEKFSSFNLIFTVLFAIVVSSIFPLFLIYLHLNPS